MVVYFADSNVDPTILDGLHGGRLRFAADFAGPLNSTNIVYPSVQTYTFNTALIRSTTLIQTATASSTRSTRHRSSSVTAST